MELSWSAIADILLMARVWLDVGGLANDCTVTALMHAIWALHRLLGYITMCDE